ncbi:hypothetical protein KDA_19040 [Dictyobacter alpinus]|uniref:Uncharacterized protein n=1 Tax=Dictyobacter alpinus TaxID=2014873 RepID=A0A402B4Z4_9CHLR|nr:hypothetical protein [Dictyobacter alpinus]GCE26420.1 hypothetical protein KDA_19040 [Dictyobacter alpinus]
MQEEQSTPLSLSGPFDANPYLYDYLHRLRFSPSGGVEMLDGAGQCLNTRVKGRFAVQARDHGSALVQFSDLVELKLKPPLLAQTIDQGPFSSDYSNLVFVENPDYQNEEPIRTLAPISVLVTREEGLFPFAQQVMWKIGSAEESPCLLYRVRYIFETDPLEHVRDRRAGRPYYQQIGWEEPNIRYYYCRDDEQTLTALELAQMGISLP